MSALPLLPKEQPKDKNRQLAEDICNLQIPSDVQFSPNGGKKIVYSTSFDWQHSPEKHVLSTLWFATTGQAQSARQLTSGKFNDSHPRWSPDGSLIAFISDREKPSESKAIYTIPMLEGGCDPTPITDASHASDIESFSFSPDGKQILFLSADEKSEARKKAEDDETDGPHVWGEDWELARLRIVDLATKTVKCLTPTLERHIIRASWSPDGTQIAFASVANPNIEELWLSGLTVSTISLSSPSNITDLSTFKAEVEDLHWATDNNLYFRSTAPLLNVFGSQAIYTLSLTSPSPSPSKIAFGISSDAVSLIFRSNTAFVAVANHFTTDIHLLSSPDTPLFSYACDIDAWDVSYDLSHPSDVHLAVKLSDVNHPDELFTTHISGSTPGALTQLSSHGGELAARKYATEWRELKCRSGDGAVEIEALFIASAHATAAAKEPQPTFVMIHGGPTDRNTPGFNSYYFQWAPYILSQGYSILLPQYRGSSARGEEFGMWSIGGVGTLDHADVVTLTDHAIKEGYVDKERVLVGGWSQGGFLSYLCAVRNGLQGLGWKFQAAIPGAGVCETDAMMLTSDLGSTLDVQLNNGKAIWTMEKDDTASRVASAIWEVQGAVDAAKEKGEMVIPPVLILHGEKDERCPVTQAEGFRRALRAHGLPCEYVTYPRQEHLVAEQRARIDMMLRIGRWCDTYIGDGRKQK